MAYDEKVKQAEQVIEQFRARGAQATRTNTCAKDSIWLNVCRNKVADGQRGNVWVPRGVSQNSTNLCGVAAFIRQWIEDDPVGYAYLGIQLYENGAAYMGRGQYHGKEIRPSKELKNSTIPFIDLKNGRGEEMNHADWIVMASIREAFNSVFNYSADEGIFAIRAWNFPSEVVATFKAAGYVNIVNEAYWTTPQGYDSLKEASAKFQNKWRVVLLINADMLDDKELASGSFVTTANHWIGLQSAINMSYTASEWRVSPFTVFTWGKDKQVPESLPHIPLAKLLRYYYGYIAAKY